MKDSAFNDDDQIALKNTILRYLQYWKIFVFTFILAILITFIYLKYTKDIYNVESKIKILDDSKGLNLPSDALGLLTKSKVNLENEIEVIKSKKLLEPVVKDLNLNIKYYHEGKLKKRELWKLPFTVNLLDKTIKEPFSFNIEITTKGFILKTKDTTIVLKTKNSIITTVEDHRILIKSNTKSNHNILNEVYFVNIESVGSALNSLAENINVETVGEDSDILSISIKAENVEKTKATINNIVEKFNDDGINDRRLISKRTVEFIQDRFKYLSKELNVIETKKKSFKQANNLSFIEADAALDIQRKSVSENSLLGIETQLALSKMLNETIQESASKFNILPANLGLENEIINILIAEYNKLVIDREKLLETAGKENPVLASIESKINSTKSNIKKSITTYIRQINITLNQQEKDFNKSNQLISKIPSDEQSLRSIEREQQIKENLYLLLLQKREESAIAYAVTSPSIKIIDYANSSKDPISPKRSSYYVIALLLSIIIPFFTLYLYFLFDTKIKSINEIGFLNSSIPIIGEIPYFGDHNIFQNKNDRSIHAETFRVLSSNLNFALPIKTTNTAQVIIVTSSITGEGKTYVTSNLSLVLASYSKKVLLIGADMRKPKLKEAFRMEHNGKGLSSYLHEEQSNWRELLVKYNDQNNDLDILFTGIIPPNPSNLLSNGRFEKLIEEAKKEYDYIIIDSTPTIYVNDTFLLSNLADTTVYITRYNYTDKQLLKYTENLAVKNKLKNLVYVFNGIQNKSGFQYNYNYGYGYGYGVEE